MFVGEEYLHGWGIKRKKFRYQDRRSIVLRGDEVELTCSTIDFIAHNEDSVRSFKVFLFKKMQLNGGKKQSLLIVKKVFTYTIYTVQLQWMTG